MRAQVNIEVHFIEFICRWEFVCEHSKIPFLPDIHHMAYVSRWDLWDIHSTYVREMSGLLLGSPDSSPFCHSMHLWCDISSCFDVGWPTLTFHSLHFPLSLFHYLSWFCFIRSLSFFLVFFSLSMPISVLAFMHYCCSSYQCSILFDFSLSVFSHKTPLGPWLMRFSMHHIIQDDIGFIIGYLSLIFFHFF